MNFQQTEEKFTLPTRPAVVVPVAEHKTLGHLGDILEKCAPDIIEFRLDGLIDCLEEASTVLSACHSPRLLTVRNPREGGLATGLDTGGRAALYLSHLAHTELIDIEMSSFTEIAEVVTAVKNSRALLVASLHDFTSMPDITHLEGQTSPTWKKPSVRHTRPVPTSAKLRSRQALWGKSYPSPSSSSGTGQSQFRRWAWALMVGSPGYSVRGRAASSTTDITSAPTRLASGRPTNSNSLSENSSKSPRLTDRVPFTLHDLWRHR